MALPVELVTKLNEAEEALATAKLKEAAHTAAEANLEAAQEAEDDSEVEAIEARSVSDDKAEDFIAAFREHFGL